MVALSLIPGLVDGPALNVEGGSRKSSTWDAYDIYAQPAKSSLCHTDETSTVFVWSNWRNLLDL